jgi:hypothetical protein
VYLILGAKGVNWTAKTNQETTMPSSDEKIKAQLIAEAEAAIDRLLARRHSHSEMTLTEIEELALDFRQEIGEKATQVLAGDVAAAGVPGPSCAECGAEMHNKGRKRRRVVTRSGDIHVERTYYYCERCKQGFFPPG